MPKVSALTLCKFYPPVLLLAAAITAPPVYLPLSLLLLAAALFTAIRPFLPRFNVILYAVMILLTPLILSAAFERLTTLGAITTSVISIVLIVPDIYLLDHHLRDNTRQEPAFTPGKEGITITRTFLALAASALVLMLISPVVDKPVLLSTGGVFLLYLLGILLWILIMLRRPPLTTETTTKRIIADTTSNVSVNISSRSPATLISQLVSGADWMKATPSEITLNREVKRLDLSFTPPLAGDTNPQLNISSLDPRGFIQYNQVLEPLRLQVIPRAKYAEWLATKYLEQAGSGEISTGILSKTRKIQRGTEYIESRSYTPGDSLRDIDWKHTMKLSQIIVKEYREAGEPAAIIAVNLAVSDAVAADRLAFNMITTALTLARENIAAALSAYNHDDTILSTGIIPPQELLRRALSLVGKITPVKIPGRHLEPTDIARLRRNIHQLKKAESEPARRLLDILNFEELSIKEAARDNPATRAINEAVKQVPPPAMILLISELNHDAEAITVTSTKLAERNYTTVPLNGH